MDSFLAIRKWSLGVQAIKVVPIKAQILARETTVELQLLQASKEPLADTYRTA